MGSILLEEGIGGAYLNLLSLPEDLHMLVVGGWGNLLPVDSGPLQQQVVGTAMTADDIEPTHLPQCPTLTRG